MEIAKLVMVVVVVVMVGSGSNGQLQPLQTQTILPSGSPTQFPGFALVGNSLVYTTTSTEIYYYPNNQTFAVLNPNLQAGVLGYYSSPCDVPPFDVIYYNMLGGLGRNNNSLAQHQVQVGDTIVLYQPFTGGTQYLATIWVSQDSFIKGKILVVKFRAYFSSTNTAPPSGLGLACSSNMNYLYPIYGFQNTLVTIMGTNFGLDASQIVIHIGSIVCGSPQIVVPDQAVSCLAIGNGTNVPLSMTWLQSNRTASGQLKFNFEACLLVCYNGGFPDVLCQTCNCPVGTVGADCSQRSATVISLDQLIAEIEINIMQGQWMADQEFMSIATTYPGTLMENFPIPRYVLPYVEFEFVVALVSVEPDILVLPITTDLSSYSADELITVSFIMEYDEAQYVKVVTPAQKDANGNIIANATTAYNLEYLG